MCKHSPNKLRALNLTEWPWAVSWLKAGDSNSPSLRTADSTALPATKVPAEFDVLSDGHNILAI